MYVARGSFALESYRVVFQLAIIVIVFKKFLDIRKPPYHIFYMFFIFVTLVFKCHKKLMIKIKEFVDCIYIKTSVDGAELRDNRTTAAKTM